MSEEALSLPYFLGLAQVDELRDLLVEGVERGGVLVLDGGDVESIDTSCLQLLCAAAAAVPEGIRWLGASKTLRDAAELMGVNAHLGLR